MSNLMTIAFALACQTIEPMHEIARIRANPDAKLVELNLANLMFRHTDWPLKCSYLGRGVPVTIIETFPAYPEIVRVRYVDANKINRDEKTGEALSRGGAREVFALRRDLGTEQQMDAADKKWLDDHIEKPSQKLLEQRARIKAYEKKRGPIGGGMTIYVDE